MVSKNCFGVILFIYITILLVKIDFVAPIFFA